MVPVFHVSVSPNSTESPLCLTDRYFSRSGFQAFDFLKFVFGVCDASQLAEWIEALTALKEPDLAVGEDIPV